jgi:hypothetical protein
VFSYGGLLRMGETDMSLMFLDPRVNWTSNFPNVDLFALAWPSFRARWSLTGRRKLDSFLGGRSTVFITLQMRLKVISTNGKNATEIWSSRGGGSLVSGLRARKICISP